jgi:ADP-ribose pyrophosphatase YjhB (NUDIX family)
MKTKKISEKIFFDQRPIWLVWNPSEKLSLKTKITQVSAYCVFNGLLVLVRNKRGWCIPGGHPEKNESVEETLKRELQEEACFLPEDYDYRLVGWIKVKDPENENDEGKEYVQLRYLVNLNKLRNFVADEEIFERKLVEFDQIDKYLTWANNPTGRAQIRTIKNKLLIKKL